MIPDPLSQPGYVTPAESAEIVAAAAAGGGNPALAGWLLLAVVLAAALIAVGEAWGWPWE